VAFVNITIENASWYDQGRSSAGWIIRNSILDARGNKPAGVPIAICPDCKNILISNNIYIPNASFWGGGYVGRWNGEYMKFEYNEWSNASGDRDSMGIDPDLDPLFVDQASHGYHLASSSFAIDRGHDVGLSRDFEANPVPQGNAPDIGAYEYGTSPYAKEDLNQDGVVNSLDLQLGVNVGLDAEQTPNIRQ
jgi:hypothetical protein